MEALLQKIAKIPLMQRFAIVAAAVLALVVGNYFVVISPLETKIAALDNQINKLDAQLVQKKAIARDLTRYRVEVERLKQRLNEALTLLPNEAEIPELLQKIASLVEQSDLQMKKFEPQSEQAAGFYAKIPVKMQIAGNYHSIAVFFDKVAKLARIVNVTDLKFAKPKVENKRVVLDAEFLATTFKFVERGPQAAEPAAKGKGKAAPKAKAK